MAPPTKRRKHLLQNSRALSASGRLEKQVLKRKEASVEKWEIISENFSAHKESLANPKGKHRTFEENKMLLLALRGVLDANLSRLKLGEQENFNWTSIEREVAKTFQVGLEYVNNLRREFLATGEVAVWERRGVLDAPDHAEEEELIAPPPVAIPRNNHNPRSKLLPHHLLALCQWVDRQHGEGRTVTNSKAQNFIRITFEIEVTQRSVRRYFARLGLSWQKVKKKKRTLDGYRIDAS